MFFASESNSYPLFYHQSPSCTNAILDNGNTLFHHHHHGRYNDNYLLQPTYPSSSENPIVKLSSEPSINQENTINYPSNMTNPMSDTRRSTGKKDRHTKICTAQGIRDRRVRLSMSIAREFFNLQDMLGFDKASETLGWLLTKSKAAIDELSNTSNNSYTITPIEELNEEYDENVDDEKSGLTEISSSKKRKRRELNHLKEQNLVEEVRREKARERARERTRKKKTIVDDHNNHHQQQHQLESLDHHHHQIHQRVQQDLMICQSSYSATSNSIPTISKGVNVGEAVVTKDNKSRSRSSVNYNYDMMSLKDDQESGNHYNDCFNKSAYENCNCSGIMQQPAGLFPALNIINLSTEIHINARPWDTCINQIQHY